MLKIIVIIDCDICLESFERIAVSTDRNSLIWEHLPLSLAADAEKSGWDCHAEDYCYSCIQESVDSHQPSADEGTEIDF
jgi:hypothetical protein